MEQGWVYILINPTIPGMVKVGRTTRQPADRVAELSGATGVATPFVLVFEQPFLDCAEAERAIHATLDARGMRVTANREFFRGQPGEVVRVVLDYACGREALPELARAKSTWDLLSQGDEYLFGVGDTPQDVGEAMAHYRLAASRGSVVALERLGAIIAHAHVTSRGSRNRAMGYLREGIRQGNYYCYCEIAAIAADEGHAANFLKAWDLFFAHRATSYLSEAERGIDRYATALQRYVVTCFALGLIPAHNVELAENADILVRIMTTALAQIRASPEASQSLIIALRWVRVTLLHRHRPVAVPRRGGSWLARLAPGRRRYANA